MADADVIRVVKEGLQTVCDRHGLTAAITDDTRPYDDIAGFDSLHALEVALEVERTLTRGSIDDGAMIFGRVNGTHRSVAEAARWVSGQLRAAGRTPA